MSVLTPEQINEWAAKGDRSPGPRYRMPYIQAGNVGVPLKAKMRELAKPLIDWLLEEKISGAYLSIEDSATAPDIQVDVYPLPDEMQSVVRTWGSICVEIDSRAARKEVRDSHEVLRSRNEEQAERIATLEEESAQWKSAFETGLLIQEDARKHLGIYRERIASLEAELKVKEGIIHNEADQWQKIYVALKQELNRKTEALIEIERHSENHCALWSVITARAALQPVSQQGEEKK